MTALGPYAEGFAAWRRILGAVQEPEAQREVFENAIAEVAGFVARGLDRAAAADELTDMASSIGLDDADEVQAAIAAAFAKVNGPDRVPDDWSREEAHAGNGGAAPTWSPAQEKTSNASNAGALKTMTFAPIKYVVPGIIVEGLTLLAGKPKLGKSWLLLHAAVAVARGGFTLGELHCIEGDVLYCALEDNLRRLQSRMTKLLGLSQDWPTRLDFYCEMPRLVAGGLDKIKAWIKSKTAPRLIIIDTLAMVKAPKQRDQTNYDADYSAVLELRALASEAGIAIVLVHHLRKADADDAFDTVSGTLGLTGAPDTVLVLKRDTNGTIVLHGRGRDLTEIEMAMSFDQDSCLWRITGDAEDVRRSAERNTILAALDEAGGEPLGPNDIAAATGMRAGNVRKLVGKLLKEGAIERAGYGKYRRRDPRAPAAA